MKEGENAITWMKKNLHYCEGRRICNTVKDKNTITWMKMSMHYCEGENAIL